MKGYDSLLSGGLEGIGTEMDIDDAAATSEAALIELAELREQVGAGAEELAESLRKDGCNIQ